MKKEGWIQQDTLMEDIERIEVIRGPGATVWDANAVNGVINIITKKAADTQSGNNPHDNWHSARGGFRLDHTNGINQLTLQGDLFINRIGDSLLQPSLISPFTKLDIVDATEKGGNIRFRWDRTMSEKSSIMLQTYYDRVYNQLTPWTKYAESFDVDFQHRFPLLSTHDVTWGLNYRLYNNRVADTELTVFTPAQKTNHNFSAFIRNEITLLPDKLSLSIGTRLDHNDFTGLEIQPSGRLMLTLNEQNSIWLSVSRAVRIPSRGENDVTIAGRVLQGLPGLGLPAPVLMAVQESNQFASEKLIAYEMGYRRQLAENASIDLASFINDYSQLRDFRFGQMMPGQGMIPHWVLPVIFSNDVSAFSYGVESSVD